MSLWPHSHCSTFTWKRSKTNPFWPCVHNAPLWKRSFSKTLPKTHKFETSAFWKRSVFIMSTKNGGIWKCFTFLCWKAIDYNGIQTLDWLLLTATDKGIVLKGGFKAPFCWSSVFAYRFHGVFIWKRSNVKGQRVHQQKQIETKTGQCERGLWHRQKSPAHHRQSQVEIKNKAYSFKTASFKVMCRYKYSAFILFTCCFMWLLCKVSLTVTHLECKQSNEVLAVALPEPNLSR